VTHLAIQEHVNGKVVDWMELVSDEDDRKQAIVVHSPRDR
jgi:hypothetical protein